MRGLRSAPWRISLRESIGSLRGLARCRMIKERVPRGYRLVRLGALSTPAWPDDRNVVICLYGVWAAGAT